MPNADQGSASPGAGFARWWSRWYTRGLPVEVRDRRVAELASDVFEHAYVGDSEGSRGPGAAIAWRTARGIPADVSWRRQEMRAMRHADPTRDGSRLHNAWAVGTQAWFAPLAVSVGVFDLLASLAVLQDENSKMPGQVIGPIVMTALGLSLATGLWLRWRAGRAVDARTAVSAPAGGPVPKRTIGLLVALLALTLVLVVIGVAGGGAPVFFVALLVIGGTVLVLGGKAITRAVRSPNMADKAGLADALIIVGTLPALALFWMVIPPLVALAVIAGVLGTSLRLRAA